MDARQSMHDGIHFCSKNNAAIRKASNFHDMVMNDCQSNSIIHARTIDVILRVALVLIAYFQKLACLNFWCNVIFILHQKIQKMAKCTFWYQLTWVVLDTVQRVVKWLCVCVLFITTTTVVQCPLYNNNVNQN